MKPISNNCIMSFRTLWLSRQLEHQNMSIISKDIDSQRKEQRVGSGGRGAEGNPFDKEDNKKIIPLRCAYILISYK